MTARPRLWARVDLERERVEGEAVAATTDDSASTPYQKLVRAAERGQFEALVREVRPAEPVAMVTPEEREAALRAAGRWPADKSEPPPAPPPAPEPEPPRELTPNEQYIAEHCQWRKRPPAPRNPREGQYMTEYNVLTGEIIGDGYIHYDDEDDE
jgi:hypothetical protein